MTPRRCKINKKKERGWKHIGFVLDPVSIRKVDELRYEKAGSPNSVPLMCRKIVIDKINPNYVDFELTPDEIKSLDEKLNPEMEAAGIETVSDLCRYIVKRSLSKEE